MSTDNIASMIDHTILKATATSQDVKNICSEAIEFGFASVCVNSQFVPLVARELKGTEVKVCTVVGFPLGCASSKAKAEETMEAISQGAQEIDMVISVGKLKEGDDSYVESDIRQVVEASGDALVKVIIETCYLTDQEKARACKLAEKAGADFVKTSTGFGTGGATVEDVALMKKTVPSMKVKASGGIRDRETALKMLSLGAQRLGTSSGVLIVKGEGDAKSDSAY